MYQVFDVKVDSNCKCTTSGLPEHFMGCPVVETFSWPMAGDFISSENVEYMPLHLSFGLYNPNISGIGVLRGNKVDELFRKKHIG